jgi:RNA polymerase sigma-70 factor (ECF subfamily)
VTAPDGAGRAATPTVTVALVTPATVEAWSRAAAAGDRGAFARLFEAYGRVVHAVLLARVPARETEDLAQEVFLSAWRSLRRLRDPAAFGPWICRIARNRATDFLRRRGHRRTEPLEEPAVGAPPSAEAREALEAIRALPSAYRETLLLRLVEGLSGPEIAARTGRTPGSVRVNLHRGMRLLRERLGAEGRR